MKLSSGTGVADIRQYPHKRERPACRPHVWRAILPSADNNYVRERDLPRLMAVWPRELTDTSEAGRSLLIERIRNALRAERQRGLAGHWTYDLARHAAMLAAYRAEAEDLERLRRLRAGEAGSALPQGGPSADQT
jgi:hypothetical protein